MRNITKRCCVALPLLVGRPGRRPRSVPRGRAQEDGALRPCPRRSPSSCFLEAPGGNGWPMRVEQALVRLGVERVPLLGRRAGVGMRVGAVLGRVEQCVERRAVRRRAGRALRDDGLERARVVEHVELAGRADDAGRGLRILDAGERDRDLVAGLLADLRLTHAELVDARADDRDRLVDLILRRRVLRVVRDGLEHDLETALEVEAEHGRLAPRDDARESEQDEHGQQDQVILGSVGHATPHTSRPWAAGPYGLERKTLSSDPDDRHRPHSAGSGVLGRAASAGPTRPAMARRATRIDDIRRDLETYLVAVKRRRSCRTRRRR